jgi:tRNA (mo5U34)-methyltransferase
MIDYQPLIQRWQDGPLHRWSDILPEQLRENFNSSRYGDLPRWLQALEQLPALQASRIELDSNRVTVGTADDATSAEQELLRDCLHKLHPWRKGPFELFGVHIDTEWRSDWKWERLAHDISPLAGRRVLDVGCGSGYHCWRMLGAGAAQVIGIDPTPLFVVQFWALQHYIGNPDVWVLPLGIQHMPEKLRAFDTAFSMGILYHRRSPMDHLLELRDCLVGGGQLVLETLVIEGGPNDCLVPQGRYARMGNVWFIPSCEMLESWLRKLGFKDVRTLDVGPTSTREQRSTEWMRFHSLADFLDPEDSSKTLEGYPAPRRAVLTATAP